MQSTTSNTAIQGKTQKVLDVGRLCFLPWRMTCCYHWLLFMLGYRMCPVTQSDRISCFDFFLSYADNGGVVCCSLPLILNLHLIRDRVRHSPYFNNFTSHKPLNKQVWVICCVCWQCMCACVWVFAVYMLSKWRVCFSLFVRTYHRMSSHPKTQAEVLLAAICCASYLLHHIHSPSFRVNKKTASIWSADPSWHSGFVQTAAEAQSWIEKKENSSVCATEDWILWIGDKFNSKK